MKKARADIILHTQGLVESTEQGSRCIMAGLVYLETASGKPPVRVEKPGQMLPFDAPLYIEGKKRFVSRGAYKLLTALEYFSLDTSGMIALDAGASTGGFTDCLLQHGATKVYAVDVGTHQLHERLRSDPRVISLESVNLRLAEPELIPEEVDIVVADVSFISLTAILPTCMTWLKRGGYVAALIKPQFEVASSETCKGVVRDQALRDAAVEKVIAFAEKELGLQLLGVVPSTIKGPKGNQEYMAVWRRTI